MWRRYTIFVTRRNYVALLSLIRIEIRLSNYTQSCTQPPVSSALCHFVIAVVAIPCNCSTCFEIAIKLTISTIIRCHGLSNVYFYSPPFACTSFRLVAGQRIENRNIKRTRRSIHATDTLPRSSMFIKCVVASRCLIFPLIFSTIDILVVFIFFFFFRRNREKFKARYEIRRGLKWIKGWIPCWSFFQLSLSAGGTPGWKPCRVDIKIRLT